MGVNFFLAVELRVIVRPEIFERVAAKDEIDGNEHGVCHSHRGTVLATVGNHPIILGVEEAVFVLLG